MLHSNLSPNLPVSVFEFDRRVANFKKMLMKNINKRHMDFVKTNNEFIEKYEFKKDNLAQALSQNNEIYIHGKYIALLITLGLNAPVLNFTDEQLARIF